MWLQRSMVRGSLLIGWTNGLKSHTEMFSVLAVMLASPTGSHQYQPWGLWVVTPQATWQLCWHYFSSFSSVSGWSHWFRTSGTSSWWCCLACCPWPVGEHPLARYYPPSSSPSSCGWPARTQSCHVGRLTDMESSPANRTWLQLAVVMVRSIFFGSQNDVTFKLPVFHL